MSAFTLTSSQKRAVFERGGAMLVSAGAGAGKTAVLVERLMTWLDDGQDLDRFLVITYTKAAAAELRQRIYDALAKRVSQREDGRHFRRQLIKLSGCDISTIHAFCKRLLDEHPASGGLRPGARLLDETEREQLLTRTVDDLLEDCYESMAEPFASLAASASDARGDRLLVFMIRSVYEKTRGLPHPEDWLAAQEESFDQAAGQPPDKTFWGDLVMDAARKLLDCALSDMRRIYAEIRLTPAVEKSYGPAFREDILWIERMQEAISHSWDYSRNVVGELSHLSLKPCRKFDDADFLSRCKTARTRFKKRAEKLARLLDGAEASHRSDFLALTPIVKGLVEVVRRFIERLEREKQRLNVFDFSDLEHRALALLTGGGGAAPSSIARRISQRYTEILVDEYQDISPIQERIVFSVSRNEGNLYWVGDARQSIYRFRLAEPALFLQKYNAFPDTAPEGQPRRVLLGENFRSRPEVIDAVNALFAGIMSPQTGEMAYTTREYLRAAGSFPGDPVNPGDPGDRADRADHICELLLLDTKSQGSPEVDAEEDNAAPSEAKLVAARIRALIRDRFPIREKSGELRSIRPGDIAILMRAPKARAAVYVNALSDAGVPCRAEGEGNFFRTPEILTALALLQVTDNPRQDVALLAALRCPAWGFGADLLLSLRRAQPEGGLFDMLTGTQAAGNDAASAFLAQLSTWRLLAPDLTISELLARIYADTDLDALYAAQPGGPARRDNLAGLLSLAGRYDAGRARGLSDFLLWIAGLQEQGQNPIFSSQTFDAVSIMSIHRSKGLEFPVVILAATAKRFNEADIRAPVLFHTHAGLGLKRRDDVRMIEYPTLSHRAVAGRLTEEMLAEEMRMLYVAMTRAREKLIVTAAPSKASEVFSKWNDAPAGCPLPPRLVAEGRSYLDWLCMHLTSLPEASLWRVETIRPEDLAEMEAPPAPHAEPAQPGDLPPGEITFQQAYVYPFAQATVLPSKLTATGLKKFDSGALQTGSGTAAFDGEPQPVPVMPLSRPRFVRETVATLTPAERGTALHMAMQFADYARCLTRENAQEELERLARDGFLTRAQTDTVDAGRIAAFFASPLGLRMMASDMLAREFRFSLLADAQELTGQCPGEEILLQGVVDCYFREPKGLVIVDYKTDHLVPGEEETRAETYLPQLAVYARALREITGEAIQDSLLYFFATGRAVSLGGDPDRQASSPKF